MTRLVVGTIINGTGKIRLPRSGSKTEAFATLGDLFRESQARPAKPEADQNRETEKKPKR